MCVGVTLWQFLLDILESKSHTNVIAWTDEVSGEFQIFEPEHLSQLWGRVKGRPAMNYSKLSRGLRYYYDKGIMSKVTGKRYAYRFAQRSFLKHFQGMDSEDKLSKYCGMLNKGFGPVNSNSNGDYASRIMKDDVGFTKFVPRMDRYGYAHINWPDYGHYSCCEYPGSQGCFPSKFHPESARKYHGYFSSDTNLKIPSRDCLEKFRVNPYHHYIGATKDSNSNFIYVDARTIIHNQKVIVPSHNNTSSDNLESSKSIIKEETPYSPECDSTVESKENVCSDIDKKNETQSKVNWALVSPKRAWINKATHASRPPPLIRLDEIVL